MLGAGRNPETAHNHPTWTLHTAPPVSQTSLKPQFSTSKIGVGGGCSFRSCELNNGLTDPVAAAWRWSRHCHCITTASLVSGLSTGVFVYYRYRWSCRPLTSLFSLCAFVLTAACTHEQQPKGCIISHITMSCCKTIVYIPLEGGATPPPPPLQGPQPTPSHCLPDAKCQPQWHL